jgi:hypothetical protein
MMSLLFILTVSVLRIVYMSMFLSLYTVDRTIEISETNRKSILGLVSADLAFGLILFAKNVLMEGRYLGVPIHLYSIGMSSWMISVVSRENANDPSLRTSIKVLRGFTYVHLIIPVLAVVMVSIMVMYATYVGTKTGFQTFSSILNNR